MSENHKILDFLLTPHSILSANESSSDDQEQSNIFETRLKTIYEYDESPLEREFKEQVYQELKYIIDQWLQEIALNTKDSDGTSMSPSGNFYIFGSFRMEVNHKESDLDTICIVPQYVSRDEHFFGQLLISLKSHSKVTDIYPISDAMVPLIKLKFSNIPIDILFARLEIASIPKDLDFLKNDEDILKKIDEKSYKGLNGIRTADIIMRSIKNPKEYRLFLKLIKLWAKNQLIYSSVMGYLGGISWAILAAKICQLYPNYSVNRLLERFFFIYSLWIWDEMPVLLENLRNNIETVPNSKLLQFQWDEKAEKTEMSIITPAFPCMNSSHTVSITTCQIIRKSLRKGYKAIRLIKKKEKDWDFLFEKTRFFEKFSSFIEISIVAKKNEGDFLIWKGHYESRLRKFIRIIENLKLHKLASFHLNPIGFDRKDEDFPFCVSYYIGVKVTEENANYAKLVRMKEIDLDSVVRNFLDSAVESHQFIPEYMNTRIRIVNKGDIDPNISGKVAKKLLLKEKIVKLL